MMRKKLFIAIFTTIICIAMISGTALSAQTLTVTKVSVPPEIDGSAADSVWKTADIITVKDIRTGADVTLKAVYTKESIYFLVNYPDKTEDILHKPWVWDKDLEAYTIGSKREDTFTFKWNMESKDVDLSNFSDDTYTADVWYWKAHRTNPAGFSDDKSHVLASTPGKKALELSSKSKKRRYLMRIGDKGKGAQKKRILTEYVGDVKAQYVSVNPKGSRADVMAKGVWKNGTWTIEFARKLQTGHADDIQFFPSSKTGYLFGISVPGLYGEPIDRTKAHWYGQGRISEKLYLVFK